LLPVQVVAESVELALPKGLMLLYPGAGPRQWIGNQPGLKWDIVEAPRSATA
jgi:hypothetical protein